MPLKLLKDLEDDIAKLTSQEALHEALTLASRRMGFDYFALNYDEWLDPSKSNGLLIHDYPILWAGLYLNLDLWRNDPVRRTSERRFSGFAWHDISHYVSVTQGDRRMLLTGYEHDLADGYTVPRHLPGIATGSCSFVVGRDKALPAEMLPIAEMVGALALCSAMQIGGTMRPRHRVKISDRQRDCVLLSACGNTAGQTADILGIKKATVIQHLRTARERYDVNCSESLVLSAIIDGLFGFAEVIKGRRKS